MPPRVGSYEPLAVLAQGDIASAHVARQAGEEGGERLVLIKRVRRDAAEIPSRVDHPNVVRVIDVSRGEGELVVVHEYVESVSLAELLAAGERLAPAVASRVVIDALSGLQAAHEASVLHGEVSPKSILVGSDGVSRIVDFGIAEARAADRWSDISAAGVVLRDAMSAAAHAPRAIDEVVRRATERDPARRFASAAEMRDALAAACPPAAAREVGAVVERAPALRARREQLREGLARSAPSPKREEAAVDARCPVSPGEVIAGKYVVDRVIGAGAIGVVVAAHHAILGEPVAIKFLVNHEEALAERFIREFRIIAKLRGEHVARVLDAGRIPQGAPYMVMEFLSGRTMLEHIRGRRFAPAEATDIALQICEGLAEPHGAGITHRDIKPGNLFIVPRADGRPLVKILDFGIAKLEAPIDEELTKTGVMLGSPGYAAPEQLLAPKTADARCDIWSVGVLLYRLLGGRAPFKGESLSQVCLAVVRAEPPPLRAVRPEIPEELAAIVERCLAKEPAGRFADVAALAAALEPFGSDDSRGAAARVAETLARARNIALVAATSGEEQLVRSMASANAKATADADASEAPPASSMSDAPRASSRRAWWALGVGAAAVVVVAAGVAIAARGADSTTAAIAASGAGVSAANAASVAAANAAPADPSAAPADPSAAPADVSATPTAASSAPSDPNDAPSANTAVPRGKRPPRR